MEALARALLPLSRGVETAKQNVLTLVHGIGLSAVQAMLGADAEKLVGTKGKHQADGTTHHWGSTPTQLPLGGRRIRVDRRRVRGTDGPEVTLPILSELRPTRRARRYRRG